MKALILVLSLFSSVSIAQTSIIEKAANEWQVEVDQAAQRGTVATYFLFRDLEIRSENSLLKTEAEVKAFEAERDFAKEVINRSLEVFQKRALSKEEYEKAELWVFKTEKELEKARLKVQREKDLIEISRLNRQEAFNGENIGYKLPKLYLSVWAFDCKTNALNADIALAERDQAKRINDRRTSLFKSNSVSGFSVLEAMAALKKAEHNLEGARSLVTHCQALELLPKGQ